MAEKLKLAGVILCYMAITVNAAIAMDLKQFLQAQKDPEARQSSEMYLAGIAEGFAYANAELIYDGKKPFFCRSKELAFNESNHKNILAESITRYEKMGVLKSQLEKLSIVSIYFEGLQITFPCQ